ncbi:UDP-2,3-diacylglucosamine diphosphatase [Litorivivens sp.]|uniref:UDP-2,3-diacylglucosamine diphosphatase n=1 Tax=Litorivivens sp. TaxID=2020868 RepID=UPI0035688361
MTTLFISDLHLDEKRPDIFRAFLHFLNDKAAKAETLYVLGDLFEAWVGDDDDATLARNSVAAFRKLSDSGTQLYFLHGNRDFLLGKRFAEETGGTLLSDPCKIELYGTPTLLMHGDSLCTADTEYQKLRQQLRSQEWQQQLLSQPLAARRQLAEQLRMASSEATSNKAEDIMDVTPAEVLTALSEHGCKRLIHGHTHRPARHALKIDGQDAERIVLGDWDSHLWYLQASADSLALEKEPI